MALQLSGQTVDLQIPESVVYVSQWKLIYQLLIQKKLNILKKYRDVHRYIIYCI
mgnify:CR=1 FL=1